MLWNLSKISSHSSLNILVSALEFKKDTQQRVSEIFWFLLWNLPKILINFSLNILVYALEFIEDFQPLFLNYFGF
jgi:hypothetical protein